ncbi:MAG TPA: DUF559 domain-containing protein [Solirubrobacter sp.]|nr:DUF559 domain-containing protein [Solirubrobacter sp.]
MGEPWGVLRSPVASGKSIGTPPTIDARIAAVSARQHGLITIAQLRAVGLGESGVSRRVRRGVLHRRHRGVYVVGQPALSGEGEWLAAVLAAGPGAVLGHRCAGKLFGVSRFAAPVIDVIARGERRIDGVRIHIARRLDVRDVTTHRGIPVTTVHRLFVDLTESLTAHQIANVIHEAAFRGRFVEAAVRDAMARANGRHRLAVLERAIALHRAGSAGTRSGGEDAFLALYPDDEPGVNMAVEGQEVDFHWPARRLVVEVDGSGHGRPATRADDARRDRVLRAAGWTVLRFSDEDVRYRPEAVRAHVYSRSNSAA